MCIQYTLTQPAHLHQPTENFTFESSTVIKVLFRLFGASVLVQQIIYKAICNGTTVFTVFSLPPKMISLRQLVLPSIERSFLQDQKHDLYVHTLYFLRDPEGEKIT